MPNRILGLSAFYHDSAACLLVEGVPAAAAQEERFSRRKHDASFPRAAIEYCLREGGATVQDLDQVVFYDKPILKFQRLLETYVHFAPRGLRSFLAAMPPWLRQKLKLRDLIRRELGGYEGPVLFTEHHESHAASAFFPSPFERAAILTVDGVGERATASLGRGAGHRLEILAEQHFPHSLGLLYSAFTTFCGFEVNSGEYKLMGLAPYGEPRYVEPILSELVELGEDGGLRLNQRYFTYATGLEMTGRRFAELFGGPPRSPESALTQREMDLAASVQRVTEEAMLKMAAHAKRITGEEDLVLAGGVALNCVANGRLLREGPFRDLWIQPAAGDAGGALGAALFVYHQLLDGARSIGPPDGGGDRQRASLLGPAFTDEEIGGFLTAKGITARRCESPEELGEQVAAVLEQGKVVGWFQGRMEFGPRALGARSILADPRRADMQSRLNLKIKFRESFRPFAPAVLAERAAEYFDLDRPSPYMLLVCDVAARPPGALEDQASGTDGPGTLRCALPAVTHVDGSARVQTVTREDHPLLHTLLCRFHQRTGCPVLVNTSLNVRGEPIVCTPAEAWRCFRRTGMDVLVLGSFLLDEEAKRAESDGFAEDRPGGAGRGGGFWRLVARGWMSAGLALGRLISAVALSLVFYAVLTPVGFVLRLLGRRLLDTGFRDGCASCWRPKLRAGQTLARYERLY